MSLVLKLRAAMADFDGAAVSMLSEASLPFRADPQYSHALVFLFDDPEPTIQIGASWLLLDHVKTKKALRPEYLDELAPRLEGVTAWMAALHVLQALDFYKAPHHKADKFAAFCQQHLTHDRPFLRAWSMNALCRLAAQHTAYRPEAQRARQAALEDKSASVRARARKAQI